MVSVDIIAASISASGSERITGCFQKIVKLYNSTIWDVRRGL